MLIPFHVCPATVHGTVCGGPPRVVMTRPVDGKVVGLAQSARGETLVVDELPDLVTLPHMSWDVKVFVPTGTPILGQAPTLGSRVAITAVWDTATAEWDAKSVTVLPPSRFHYPLPLMAG